MVLVRPRVRRVEQEALARLRPGGEARVVDGQTAVVPAASRVIIGRGATAFSSGWISEEPGVAFADLENVLGLQSDVYDVPTLYDEASTVMAQRISQIAGVGQVSVVGASSPAVRVELNPAQLAHYGISLPSVASAISGQNSNIAQGQLANANSTSDIVTDAPSLTSISQPSGVVTTSRTLRIHAGRSDLS